MFKQKIIEKLKQKIKFTSGVIQNVMIDFQRIRQNFHKRIECISRMEGILNIYYNDVILKFYVNFFVDFEHGRIYIAAMR